MMRVIYRSASRVRRSSGWQLFVREMSKQPLSAIFPLTKKHRACRFTLNLLSWVIAPIFLLLVGVVLLMSFVHKYSLLLFLHRLRPTEELEVQWKSEVVSFAMLMDGFLDGEIVKKKVRNLIAEKRRTSKATKIQTSFVGVRFWKKQENFHIDNHVFEMPDTWRGSRLSESTVKFCINEICSFCLNCHHPPWSIYLIPFTTTDTLSQSQAVLIRAHTEIIQDFNLEDMVTCDTKYFLSTNVLQNGKNCCTLLQRLNQNAFKYALPVFEAPRLLLTSLLQSNYLESLFDKQHPSRDLEQRKDFSWSDEIPRGLVHRMKEVSGTSSRAILVSCIAGALREYFQVIGVKIPDKWPCLMPLYDARVRDSRNGFKSLLLPVGIVDSVARLHALHRSIISSELSERNQIYSWFMRHIPSAFGSFLTNISERNYNLVVSYCFLSSDCVSLFSREVKSLSYWNSFPFNQPGLCLHLTQYASKISLSVVSQGCAVQWPELLTTTFQRQMYDLALALDVHIERKPSPSSSPTRSQSVLSFSSFKNLRTDKI